MFSSKKASLNHTLDANMKGTKNVVSQDRRFHELFGFIRSQYKTVNEVPLHIPLLGEIEKKHLCSCIESSYVSSVGPAIKEFEESLAKLASVKFAVATVNGTAALQLALLVNNVTAGTEVIVPAMTFIGTANAVSHCGADPVFVDAEPNTLGMSAEALRDWLRKNTRLDSGRLINSKTGKQVSACICVHVFGHPANMAELIQVCAEFNIPLIEDAAEALGSRYRGAEVGSIAGCGVFSFNGNKIITTGGGGAIVTNDEAMAEKARFLSTTAKSPHAWESIHEEVGFNFRMPSLNAALGCAQLSKFDRILAAKRKLAESYNTFFIGCIGSELWEFQCGSPESESNYWLNSILCVDTEERNKMLEAAKLNQIQMRPPWQLLSESKPYKHCQRGDLTNSNDLASRLINLPSSAAGLKYLKD